MGCGAEGCFGNRGVSTHPWRCGQAKGDSGQGLGTVRAACRVRGVCWFPSRLSRAVSASEAPAGPLWECCQARGSQPSPASLAAPAWLLHPPPPQACASSSRCCWTRSPCWATSYCCASSSSSSSASLASSCGQGCFVTDASCPRISACEWCMGPEMTWKWSWGWDLSQSLLLVTLSVLRLVTGLVLTLGDTLGGSPGAFKEFLEPGSPPPYRF